jgi:hypothetical protein
MNDSEGEEWGNNEVIGLNGRPGEWRRVKDTSLPIPMGFSERGKEQVLGSLSSIVKERSVVVLVRKI